MIRASRRISDRRRQGGATVKFLVWAVILFGGYSAWKFMSVSMAKTQVDRVVERAMEGVDYGPNDRAIATKIAGRASTSSVTVDPDDVEVRLDKRHGERAIPLHAHGLVRTR